MLKKQQTEPLPLPIKLAYVAGQLGWSIASFGVMNLLYYFYDANLVKGVPMFQRYLPTVAILSVIAGAGRILDAITDPIIAGLSDRSKHPLGRRRFFMAIGGLPFIVLSVLAFIPPVQGVSWINGAWLLVMVLLFYFFMTIYITPYFALIPELGHTSSERLNISTWIALAWALGYLISNAIYTLQGIFERSGFSSDRSIQITLGVFATVSLILVYIPVFFVNEKKYCLQRRSKQGIWEAVKSSFQNKNFRRFVCADLIYFVGMTFINTGISYYVIRLLEKEKEFATTFMTVLFLTSFLLYIPIGKLAQKWGKKNTIMLSFVLLALGALCVALWGLIPGSGTVLTVLTIVFMVFPASAFSFLLYAIVGDIAEADSIITGHHKSGLFYGTRTFMSKMGNSITLLIFPFISHIGGTTTGPTTVLGLRLTLIVAALFFMVGLFIFTKYNEKEVLQTLEIRRRKLPIEHK